MHPFLFHLGHFRLPTFGVLAAVGLMLALALSEKTARLARVDPEALWNAGLFAVGAAFVVSRLLLVAAYWRNFVAYPVLLLAVPSLTPLGLLLTAAAAVLWLRWKQVPVLRAMDAWSPCATLVWAFLAVGHLAEGSDPGMPTRLPWSAAGLHPVALYAAGAAIVLTWILYARLPRGDAPGVTVGVALVGVGLAQFLLSLVRQPGVASGWGLDELQWVSIGMMVAGGVLVVFALARAE